MRPVAAFDFDGTLLEGDCLLLFHQQLRGRRHMWADWIRLLPALGAWKLGRRSTAWFKQYYLNLITKGSKLQQRKQVLDNKLPHNLLRRLRPEALARLNWHREQGHQVVIVSASPRALIQPVAEHLQADLIATETSDLLSEAMSTTLQLTSANCKGMEKVRRLEAWLGQPLGAVDLHAYGDSRGDRELLQAANHPHWRSFTAVSRPYPQQRQALSGWIPLLGLLLLAMAVGSLRQLDPAGRQVLVLGLERLVGSLPAIYGVLGVAYLGRYWRWRLLLNSVGIGTCSPQDALAWFQGFALTATPGKLGELTRVTELHQQLGYPRAPLVHAFVAERLCDLIAVGLWLLLLVPGSLGVQLAKLPSGPGLAAGLFGAVAALLVFGVVVHRYRERWSHHLPSGAMARACMPAAAVSLGIWSCESVILWLLVQCISPEHTISLSSAIGAYLLSGTAGMLSSLPGGLGVNEGTATLLLVQAGVPATLAFVIAILRRLCTVWTITALALAQRFLVNR